MAQQNLKLHVPQSDGEIVLTRGGDPDDVRRLQVSDHIVSARNADERDLLLTLVDGSRAATPKESGASAPAQSRSQRGSTDDAAAGSAAPSKE